MVAIAISLLARKINIVLEININNSSSADRGEGTKWLQNSFGILPVKVTFHFRISWLATLKFKESRKKKRENIYAAVEK